MGNDSLTSYRIREQLREFLGIFSPHFSKPVQEFLGQMLFGIQAAKDTLISEIAHALQEDILDKKTQERLERHLAKPGLCDAIHDCIVGHAASMIHPRTLIIIDPTDIQKPYAERMPYLAKVWDGSEGGVGENYGYTGCMAIACENGTRRIIPLSLRLWSTEAPDFLSENDEVEQLMGRIALATEKRGIYVYDRGGDGDWLFDFYILNGLDFIVRLVGSRTLISWGRAWNATELAKQCTTPYEDSVLFKSHGRIANVRVRYGSMPVYLPQHRDRRLWLVVVWWPDSRVPMMLLTSLDAERAREHLWEVVSGYVTRWRIEETIRYIKQSYRLEHMRCVNYERLRNLAALVAAVAYFAAAWLGHHAKLSVLVEHVAKVSRKMYKAPEFFYYALADGLRWLFVCHGKWRGSGASREPEGDYQMEFEFLTG